ncbi:MAG: NYN domain-containing protein [Candidatus Omnitrophota bacterium]
MPIIIDGWNLIRCEASGISDDDGEALDSAASLLAYLSRFQETHSDPIVVVFDSSSGHLGLDFKNNPKLRVIASKNADNYIKKYVDATPERQRRNVRVVSSDNDVYYYARSACATPIKSEVFWSKLHE